MAASAPPRPVRYTCRLALVTALVFGLVAFAGPSRPAAAVPPTVGTLRIARFSTAVAMAINPTSGATYIAARRGLVYMLRPGLSPKVVLDIRWRTKAKGEGGLLGLAFHPTLPYAYVTYTSGRIERLVEYLVRPDGTFKTSTYRRVINVQKHDTNHNGGNIDFGPDGFMYWGIGDGGGGGDPKRNGLKMNTLMGKILRIDPRKAGAQPYTVPADNPFVGVPGARSEIWALGFRNPWRWSFDSLTGDLWVGDVGQREREEIDLARATDGGGKGLSYGWSAWEGTNRYNLDQPAAGHAGPLFEYDHDYGCSITGGVVYRGSAIPDLYGAYVFADLCSGEILALTLDGNDNPTVTKIANLPAVISFGEDGANEVYAITLGGGVYLLTPGS